MDIILVKSILATLAFALAVLNLLTMGQLYGKLHLFPFPPETLGRWHRRQGDLILLLFLFIAYHCLTEATVDPKDWIVREAVLYDQFQNTVTMRFTKVAVNPKLDDALFAFTPPKGAAVVPLDPSR